MILNIFFSIFVYFPTFLSVLTDKETESLEMLKKSGPEKVRILHKSSEFHYYSSLEPVVRNAKF